MKLFILLVLTVFPYIASSRTYYVDRVNGSDANTGFTSRSAWKTLGKLNKYHFRPGDIILLRSGQVWRESLIVNSSGSQSLPIKFSSYGKGERPRILTTNKYKNWKKISLYNGGVVWQGRIKDTKNYWSVRNNRRRLPSYFGYRTTGHKRWLTAPLTPHSIKNGFFFSPLNRGVFYYRNDNGYPVNLEVGVRKYGIYIKNSQHIVIDGINVYGPGGSRMRDSISGDALILVSGSRNIVINNLEVAFGHNNGIRITNGSSFCKVINVKTHGHRSTGIYLWSAGKGNVIADSEVYSSGNVVTDTGDMGLIGVWDTPDSVIRGNWLYGNGHAFPQYIDAAISVVRSRNTIVKYNYIYNSGGGGIQIAENSDYSKVLYNIIDSWCVFGDTFRGKGSCEGIRIGGGNRHSTARNISIFNNLVSNGRSRSKRRSALTITDHHSDGTVIANNIFYLNNGNIDIRVNKRRKKPDLLFRSNIIYNRSSVTAIIFGKQYHGKHINRILRDLSGPLTKRLFISVIIVDPLLDLSNKKLLARSPAIDAGVQNYHIRKDYHGVQVPQGARFDIGPFESH